jgi:uncharacterized protein
MEKVLIAGGSGLIGNKLVEMLAEKSYEVCILSRQKHSVPSKQYNSYQWDLVKGIIDRDAIIGSDYIINLAGENISDKRWTTEQKAIIESSRVKSTELLFKVCLENNCFPKAFLTTSAIGYYGTFTSDKILSETEGPGSDFLAQVCEKWERSADLFHNKGIRTVKIRTGVVFAKDSGAYAKIANTAKKGMAAALGNGKQYVPWIHIHDIAAIFLKALEDETMHGIYNGVAPQHLTNLQMTSAIAGSLNKTMLLPKVPSFVLNAMFGEMSSILLKGSRVSAQKILDAGFQFKFPEIGGALYDLVRH